MYNKALTDNEVAINYNDHIVWKYLKLYELYELSNISILREKKTLLIWIDPKTYLRCKSINHIVTNFYSIFSHPEGLLHATHCVKIVRIRSYYGRYFSAFGLNTDEVSLRIQSECGKIQTRITQNTDTFYAVTEANCIVTLILHVMSTVTKTNIKSKKKSIKKISKIYFWLYQNPMICDK